MFRPIPYAAALAVVLAAPPALAAPPQDALPLSQVLQQFEAEADFAHFDEVEWDSDGYWEVEYYRTDGAKVEVYVDPRTGEPRR